MFAAQQFLTAKWVTMPASNWAGIVTPRDREGSHVIGGTAFSITASRSSGSLTKFTAIRRASSRISSLAADRLLGSSSSRPSIPVSTERAIAKALQKGLGIHNRTASCR